MRRVSRRRCGNVWVNSAEQDSYRTQRNDLVRAPLTPNIQKFALRRFGSYTSDPDVTKTRTKQNGAHVNVSAVRCYWRLRDGNRNNNYILCFKSPQATILPMLAEDS